jgi:hypothetical protein
MIVEKCSLKRILLTAIIVVSIVEHWRSKIKQLEQIEGL